MSCPPVDMVDVMLPVHIHDIEGFGIVTFIDWQ